MRPDPIRVFGVVLLLTAVFAGCGGGTNYSSPSVEQPAAYTVTYSANGATGGSVPVDGNKYQAGATVTVLGNTGSLADTGYTFAGWNTAANGSGTSYAQGATLTMGSANVVLYAQWTAVPTFTVSYNANGATGGSVPVDGNKYQAGATVTVLGNTGNLANTGYTFVEWNTAANGSGTSYAQGATLTMGSANVTLYAQWTAVPTFTVSYNGNGATGGSAPVDGNKYQAGATVTVLGNTGNLANTGYTFVGWNTVANGSGTEYTAGGTFTMGSANLTLYAQWSQQGSTYTVTYNGNGIASGFGVSDPNQYEAGQQVTVYGNLGFFFNPGHVFTGWNTAANGTGTAYAVGDTFDMGMDNVTLYAQWSSGNWPPQSIWGGAREVITLKADGTVWTWGYNCNGQLGDGNSGETGNVCTHNSPVPVQVLGPSGSGYLDNIVAVMGGEQHNVALKNDGTVWVWGDNNEDQLGNGGGTLSTTPIPLNGLSSVVMLASRGYHSVAVKSDGTVWDWGSDFYGALGNGLSIQNPTYTTPIEVQGVKNPLMVTAGYMFSIALMPDHTLLAWGNNGDGAIGNGTIGGYESSPTAVPGINDVVWVSAGWTHVVAIRSDGTVWTWGANSWAGSFDCEDSYDSNDLGYFCGYGKLGNGTTQDQYTPQQVQGLSGAIMALAGDSFTSVLLRDGTVWTFGSNGAGQLGVPNVSGNESLVPVQVQGLCKATYIMARDFHNEAICTDGSVWSWGSGTSGELGNGTWNDSAVPVQVSAY